MIVRSRTRNVLVNTLIVALTAASFVAGLDMYHAIKSLHHSAPVAATAPAKPALKTAGYNDGWIDGQADLADELGASRVPNNTEYAAWLKANQKDASCHLAWDGQVRPVYEVVCVKAGRTLPVGCTSSKVAQADVEACLALDYRNAQTVKNADGSVISSPDGTALIAECLSQYSGQELHNCLNQPVL
jgi:hypothetical protein